MNLNLFLSPTASNTGYGYIQWKIIQELRQLCNLDMLNPGVYYQKYPNEVIDINYVNFIDPANSPTIKIHEKVLNINYPSLAGQVEGQNSYLFTMWESDNLPQFLVNCVNKHHKIIVPCDHNIEAFKNCGVIPSISKVPLGNDQKDYHFIDRDWNITEDNPFTFLHMGFPNWRKGGDLAMKAFKKVFSGVKDVRLIMKISQQYANEHLYTRMKSSDERIALVKDNCTIEEMNFYYSKSHCQLTPSRGDGWNLFAFQGLATGLPTIVTDWCGPKEFSYMGFPLKYTKIHSTDWKSTNATMTSMDRSKLNIFGEPWGSYGEPDFAHLCELMESAYKNPSSCLEKGKEASVLIRDKFTWKHTAQKLLNVITED